MGIRIIKTNVRTDTYFYDHKPPFGAWEFGFWSFSGVWFLVFGVSHHPNSQPFRYSRTRCWFASGTLVIFMFAASKRSRRPPSRSETAPRLNASDIGPASRKSP